MGKIITMSAILKKGKYMGLYKRGESYYHMFKPEVIGTEGDIKYVRIGDYNEEFANDRMYTIIEPNKEEAELVKLKE
jgi:hypothetical protein